MKKPKPKAPKKPNRLKPVEVMESQYPHLSMFQAYREACGGLPISVVSQEFEQISIDLKNLLAEQGDILVRQIELINDEEEE